MPERTGSLVAITGGSLLMAAIGTSLCVADRRTREVLPAPKHSDPLGDLAAFTLPAVPSLRAPTNGPPASDPPLREASREDEPAEIRYASGALRGAGAYLNGKPHGPWTYFYENGSLEMTGSYDHGTPVGPWNVYDERTGLLANVVPFVAGKITGVLEEHAADNGRLRSQDYREGNVRQGPLTTWHDNGRMKFHGFMRDGKMEGYSVFWNEDGAVDMDRTGIYENGEKVAR